MTGRSPEFDCAGDEDVIRDNFVVDAVRPFIEGANYVEFYRFPKTDCFDDMATTTTHPPDDVTTNPPDHTTTTPPEAY